MKQCIFASVTNRITKHPLGLLHMINWHAAQ